MAAARYLRLVGIEALAGGDLELTEIALYSGASRVDGSATLTCSHAPAAGALANLKDGDTATGCRFAAAAVRSGGFYLQWDFGTSTDVTEIRFGAAASAARFISNALVMQSSDSRAWAYSVAMDSAMYPGSGAMTTSGSKAALYATTWNPSDKGSACVLSNGNLTGTSPSDNGSVRSTFGASAGKWYWEVTSTSSTPPGIGVGNGSASLSLYPGSTSGAWAWFANEGRKYTAGAATAYGTAGSLTGVVIGVALDMDAGTVTLYRNGVSMGVMYSGLTGTLYALCGGNSAVASDFTANFGASAFAYTPPSGHAAWFGRDGPALPLKGSPVAHTAISRALVAASAAVGAHRTVFSRLAMARDIEFGGNAAIWGTTKAKGTPNVPIKARVVLMHQRSKLPVRETWSHPTTGYFEFRGVDVNQQFLTLAEDAAGAFRPVAANRLTPEVLA